MSEATAPTEDDRAPLNARHALPLRRTARSSPADVLFCKRIITTRRSTPHSLASRRATCASRRAGRGGAANAKTCAGLNARPCAGYDYRLRRHRRACHDTGTITSNGSAPQVKIEWSVFAPGRSRTKHGVVFEELFSNFKAAHNFEFTSGEAEHPFPPSPRTSITASFP